MLTDMRVGSRLSLEIERLESGFKLTPVVRVGSAVKGHGKPKICKTEEDVLIAVETWSQDRLARLGLEKTERAKVNLG